MTEAKRQQVLQDHLIWCRKEHASALEQAKLFTTGGARAIVEHGGAAQDITDSVVRHSREVVEKMGAFIALHGAENA